MSMDKGAIKNTIPFPVTSNRMKGLGVHLTQYVQNVYTKITKCRQTKSKKT